MKLYHAARCLPLSLCYILLNPASIKAPEPLLHPLKLRAVQVSVQNEELRKAEIDVACVRPNLISKQNLRKCNNSSRSDV